MKTLLILRHAKSDRGGFFGADVDRPLNKRGLRDAPRMGKFLGKRGPLPDCVYCSTAVRTRQTAELFLPACGFNGKPQFEELIYHNSADEIVRLLRKQSTGNVLMVIGHNPSAEELVAMTTGAYETMPTCALACVTLDRADWADVGRSKGDLAWLQIPKQLPDT